MTAATTIRTRWFRRPWLLVFAIVLLAGVVSFAASNSIRAVVCLPIQVVLYGITSAKDVDEATALEAALTSAITDVHHFTRNSALQPDSPPISVIPGSRMLLTQPPLVNVYDARDRVDQDRIIAAVSAVVRDKNLKPIDLRFMDHENWNVQGNVGERGPELQLRRVRITQSGTREEGGEKTITYSAP